MRPRKMLTSAKKITKKLCSCYVRKENYILGKAIKFQASTISLSKVIAFFICVEKIRPPTHFLLPQAT